MAESWKEAASAAMDRYACGDEGAFAELYDLLAPRLSSFLLRRTRDVAYAEDLLQQTFLQMHRARRHFVPGACVMPWAFAIARRLLIDGFRKGGREIVGNDDAGHRMKASANDGSSDAPSEAAMADAGDGGCPASWMTAPAVDPSIAVPSDGGSVLLHASATGTQNYTCTQSDAGFLWSFVGPEAELHDCNAAVIGHHFASDAGPSAPEWQTTDSTYVIGKRAAPPFVPDGGAMSVPWLLLQATAHGGAGVLSRAGYIQRLYTDGGVAPSTTCDQTVAGGAQGSQKVPYSADYYFFGQ